MRNSDRPGLKELLGRRPCRGPYESRNALVFSLLYCFEVAQAPQQADTAMAIKVQVPVEVSEVEFVLVYVNQRLLAATIRDLRLTNDRGDGGHGLSQISLGVSRRGPPLSACLSKIVQ